MYYYYHYYYHCYISSNSNVVCLCSTTKKMYYDSKRGSCASTKIELLSHEKTQKLDILRRFLHVEKTNLVL